MWLREPDEQNPPGARQYITGQADKRAQRNQAVIVVLHVDFLLQVKKRCKIRGWDKSRQ